MKIINLKIGELIVTSEPVTISTILGSCISVCLFSPQDNAGGMIHIGLPTAPAGCDDENKFRYADLAIPALVKYLVKLTGRKSHEFRAKIVGGAGHIGTVNFNTTSTILTKLGIQIIGKDVGGNVGRKALFDIKDGRLQVATFSNPSISGNESVQNKKRKVLIVDDSKTIRDILTKILKEDPDFEILGTATSAIEAQNIVNKEKPDVITLDIHMPEMTGVEWLEKLLPTNPIPVVMISSLQFQDGNEVFRALELGAIDYIQKPSFGEMKEAGLLIREKVKNASYAKVKNYKKVLTTNTSKIVTGNINKNIVIAIGASTGGTEALKEVLVKLPRDIPPIVIVQHIPPVFSRAFAARLNDLCPFEVKEASDRDQVFPSRVLLAPGGKQMKLEQTRIGLVVRITDDPPVNRFRPSIDYLFNSVADTIGKKSIGVILTGMGGDGAKGLLKMKNNGAKTIGQDEESSVVYGMPKVAFEMGAVEKVLPLDDISNAILALASKKI